LAISKINIGFVRKQWARGGACPKEGPGKKRAVPKRRTQDSSPRREKHKGAGVSQGKRLRVASEEGGVGKQNEANMWRALRKEKLGKKNISHGEEEGGDRSRPARFQESHYGNGES